MKTPPLPDNGVIDGEDCIASAYNKNAIFFRFHDGNGFMGWRNFSNRTIFGTTGKLNQVHIQPRRLLEQEVKCQQI